jgi:hypothetical protein
VGGDVMLWAHHLATRWMAAFRSPRDCYVGFAAAFMLTGAQMSAMGVNHNVDWVLAALILAGVTSFAAMSGAGASTGGRPPGFGLARSEARDVPNPTLPLDPGVRALMEALAGVGVVAVWQTLLVVIAPLSRSLVPIDLVGSGVGSLSGTFATWCVIVPGAMAWLLPAHSQVVSLLRGVTVTILAAAAFVISFSSMPWAIDLAVALVATLLATARVAVIPGPFTRLGRPSDARTAGGPQHREGRSRALAAVMFRQSRAPLAQLWWDACLGPLRSGKPALIACAACFIVGGALARAHIGSEMLAGSVTTIAPLLVASWLALHVLGTPATTAGGGVRAGLFGGIGHAWTRLPLRREWVIRTFYGHGLIVGLTFVALSLIGLKITGSPPLFAGGIPGEPFSWIPLLCAVPPFAGVMACAAAGDRVRGFISLVSLVLILTALPYNSTPLGAACALTGGLPPLVHLFNVRR